MARKWKIEVTTPAGGSNHWVHDDWRWEWDNLPAPLQTADMASLLAAGRTLIELAQRTGWTKGELTRLP